MKGVAATVVFEYGCRRYLQDIGNYQPNNTVSRHRGQKYLSKNTVGKTAGHDMPPHQLQNGR